MAASIFAAGLALAIEAASFLAFPLGFGESKKDRADSAPERPKKYSKIFLI